MGNKDNPSDDGLSRGYTADLDKKLAECHSSAQSMLSERLDTIVKLQSKLKDLNEKN